MLRCSHVGAFAWVIMISHVVIYITCLPSLNKASITIEIGYYTTMVSCWCTGIGYYDGFMLKHWCWLPWWFHVDALALVTMISCWCTGISYYDGFMLMHWHWLLWWFHVDALALVYYDGFISMHLHWLLWWLHVDALTLVTMMVSCYYDLMLMCSVFHVYFLKYLNLNLNS